MLFIMDSKSSQVLLWWTLLLTSYTLADTTNYTTSFFVDLKKAYVTEDHVPDKFMYVLFANDTSILLSCKITNNFEDIVNIVLNKTNRWLCSNN